MARLTFDALREANTKRCNTAFPHKLLDWSLSDWACAMAGEAGEACDVVKKIRREDDAYVDVGEDFREMRQVFTSEHGKERLACELADVVCYADLLAARAGIDLGEAIRKKFNEVSERRGSEVKL